MDAAGCRSCGLLSEQGVVIAARSSEFSKTADRAVMSDAAGALRHTTDAVRNLGIVKVLNLTESEDDLIRFRKLANEPTESSRLWPRRGVIRWRLGK
jgi:hypothetical protein